jgi:hypothetical protein
MLDYEYVVLALGGVLLVGGLICVVTGRAGAPWLLGFGATLVLAPIAKSVTVGDGWFKFEKAVAEAKQEAKAARGEAKAATDKAVEADAEAAESAKAAMAAQAKVATLETVLETTQTKLNLLGYKETKNSSLFRFDEKERDLAQRHGINIARAPDPR